MERGRAEDAFMPLNTQHVLPLSLMSPKVEKCGCFFRPIHYLERSRARERHHSGISIISLVTVEPLATLTSKMNSGKAERFKKADVG